MRGFDVAQRARGQKDPVSEPRPAAKTLGASPPRPAEHRRGVPQFPFSAENPPPLSAPHFPGHAATSVDSKHCLSDWGCRTATKQGRESCRTVRRAGKRGGPTPAAAAARLETKIGSPRRPYQTCHWPAERKRMKGRRQSQQTPKTGARRRGGSVPASLQGMARPSRGRALFVNSSRSQRWSAMSSSFLKQEGAYREGWGAARVRTQALLQRRRALRALDALTRHRRRHRPVRKEATQFQTGQRIALPRRDLRATERSGYRATPAGEDSGLPFVGCWLSHTSAQFPFSRLQRGVGG